jgi:hypothetical protein
MSITYYGVVGVVCGSPAPPVSCGEVMVPSVAVVGAGVVLGSVLVVVLGVVEVVVWPEPSVVVGWVED